MGMGSTPNSKEEDVRPLAASSNPAGHHVINNNTIIVGDETTGTGDQLYYGGGSSSHVHDEQARYSRRSSTSSGKGGAATTSERRRRRCFRICCSCCVSTLVLLAILILLLALTVFKVKDPEIRMNSVYLDRFSLDRPSSSSSSSSPRALDLTITVDISIKNPNAASFKFGNATTFISYHGDPVGEGRSPAGKARARRTLRMNVTVDVDAERLIRNAGQLARDLISGTLPVTTYTKLGGRVNFLNVFKHHVDVVFNCSIAVSIFTSSIQDQRCERSVKL